MKRESPGFSRGEESTEREDSKRKTRIDNCRSRCKDAEQCFCYSACFYLRDMNFLFRYRPEQREARRRQTVEKQMGENAEQEWQHILRERVVRRERNNSSGNSPKQWCVEQTAVLAERSRYSSRHFQFFGNHTVFVVDIRNQTSDAGQYNGDDC